MHQREVSSGGEGEGHPHLLYHTLTQEELSPAPQFWDVSSGFQKTLAWGSLPGLREAAGRHLPHGASLEGLGQIIGLVQVLCEDSCSQPILGIVGSPNDFLYGLELQNLHHWPKDLGLESTMGGWGRHGTTCYPAFHSTEQMIPDVVASLQTHPNSSRGRRQLSHSLEYKGKEAKGTGYLLCAMDLTYLILFLNSPVR